MWGRALCAAWFAVVCASAPASAQLFLDQSFGVSVTSDVVYATGAVQFPFPHDKDLLLDLYEPTGVGVPPLKPGFVFVHGGAFLTGSKTNPAMRTLADAYAQRGYVTVSIDYRKIPDDPPTPGLTPFDRAAAAAVEDAANAVRWLRANAATYGIDPDRIAIGGYSAGAIASLVMAYSELGADAEVQAVMSLSGAMYGMESEIDAGEAPLIMIHGTDDLTVPYALALVVELAAILAPIEIEFYALSGVGHGVPERLDTWLVDGVSLNVKIRDFVFTALGLGGASVPVAGAGTRALLGLLVLGAGVLRVRDAARRRA